MGVVTSHFRDNKTTVETLEEIEKDIKRLHKDCQEQQNLQRRVAGMLLWYSIVLYMVAISFFYLFYWPQTWPRMVLCCLPLLSFPVMVWLLRKLLHWYFFRRITANELTVVELKDRKKQILEDVMENETYKRAKAILEKYDPARFKKLEKAEVPAVMSSTPGAVMRQRVMQVSPTVMSTPVGGPRPMGPFSTPIPVQWAGRQMPPTPANRGRGGPSPGLMGPVRYSPPAPPGPPMPRTILPRERGTVEKLLDLVVGDGPQNRYALICQHCKSHNGMALPEEFEYLSFRCCYCYNINQARKMRPIAPRLQFPEMPSSPAKQPYPGPAGSPRGGHPAGAPRGGHSAGTPRGGHPAGSPRGGHSAGEPRGGHSAGAPRGGHSAGEPRGGHSAGEPRGGHSECTPRGGHSAGEPRGGHSAGEPRGGHSECTPRGVQPSDVRNKEGEGRSDSEAVHSSETGPFQNGADAQNAPDCASPIPEEEEEEEEATADDVMTMATKGDNQEIASMSSSSAAADVNSES